MGSGWIEMFRCAFADGLCPKGTHPTISGKIQESSRIFVYPAPPGFSVDRPRGQAPLVLRELPETVGSKVWRGAWLLWKSLEMYGFWKKQHLQIFAIYIPIPSGNQTWQFFSDDFHIQDINLLQEFPFPRSITGGYPS